MRKYIVIVLCWVLCLSGCRDKNENERQVELKKYVFSGLNACIMEKPKYLSVKYDSIWVPSQQEVQNGLNAAYQYLLDNKEKNEKIVEIISLAKQYTIQVVGINVNGKKTIYFNFFNAKIKSRYSNAEEEKRIEGGGANFWQIKYNVEKNECFDFEVNGNG